MKTTTLKQLNTIRLVELHSYVMPFVRNVVEGRKYKDSNLTLNKYRSDKVLNRLNKLNRLNNLNK